MSCFHSNAEEQCLIQQAKLLQYANTMRIDGDFNDVTVEAGIESISKPDGSGLLFQVF